MNFTPENSQTGFHIFNLIDFLNDPLVSSLFNKHPNDIGYAISHSGTSGLEIPSEWDCWWEWAASRCDGWKQLIKLNEMFAFQTPSKEDQKDIHLSGESSDIPLELVKLIRTANQVSLPRKKGLQITISAPCHLPSISFPETEATSYPNEPHTPLRSGMSPKKWHEVQSMTSYIAELLASMASNGNHIKHVVDIGAGQGYLSRELSALRASPISNRAVGPLHVLALDSSSHQTSGAQRRQEQSYRRRKAKLSDQNREDTGGSAHQISPDHNINPESRSDAGTLTHHTIYVGGPVDDGRNNRANARDPLEEAIGQWVSDTVNGPDVDAQAASTPVLFVALHACGSLTPSILQAVLKNGLQGSANSNNGQRNWHVAAGVVVGCCYNLLETHYFPLSSIAKSSSASRGLDLTLTQSHLQLAAQVPAQWFRDPDSTISAELAIKKVAFRGLLEALIQASRSNSSSSDSEQSVGARRLGKLNNRAYDSFESFVHAAEEKMGLSLVAYLPSLVLCPPSPALASRTNLTLPSERITDRYIENPGLLRCLQVLHALRCILGPAVESLIILDRLSWLVEQLNMQPSNSPERDSHNPSKHDIHLVNLFDQASDSGRNIAITFRPVDM